MEPLVLLAGVWLEVVVLAPLAVEQEEHIRK
jgi:hypothetical protein